MPDKLLSKSEFASRVLKGEFDDLIQHLKLTTPLEPGNIPLKGRQKVANPEGGTSTVYSASANVDGKEVLLPLADEGRIMSLDEAVAKYKRTGKHLGIFQTPEAANAYAQQLHEDYAAGKYEGTDPTAAAKKATRIGPPTGDETPIFEGSDSPGGNLGKVVRAFLGTAKRNKEGGYAFGDPSAIVGMIGGDLEPFSNLLKKVAGGAEFKAAALKRIEAALKAGENTKGNWEPMSAHTKAFGDDPNAVTLFSRMWGANSPNTPVARSNYEAIQSWNKMLKGEFPLTNSSAQGANITMAPAKVPNLNRAMKGYPLQGGRGEIGKTEAMSRLTAGLEDTFNTPTIPVDIQAISGVGAQEDSVSRLYPQIKEFLGIGRGQKSYTELYNEVANIYRKGLDKFGGDFPTMWEGVKKLKGQGASPGIVGWLKKYGLLEPNAMLDVDKLENVIQNVDRSEFYGQPERMAAKSFRLPFNEEAAALKGVDDLPPTKLSPREVADLYAKDKGFASPGPHPPVTADVDFGKRVADVYDSLQHNPDDPSVKAAYGKLRGEVSDQFDYITNKGGLKAEAWTKEGQPYKNSQEMMDDVTNNNHLYYFPTESGYGTGDQIAHPLLEKGKSGLVANDELRVVHDYLAHALGGHQFGPSGEENAFREHAKLLSPEATSALATETRGQNSWVNFGKHLRNTQGNIPKRGETGYIPQAQRPFAPQKAALMPEDLQSTIGEIKTFLQTGETPAAKDNILRNAPFGEGGIMPSNMLPTELKGGLASFKLPNETFDQGVARLKQEKELNPDHWLNQKSGGLKGAAERMDQSTSKALADVKKGRVPLPMKAPAASEARMLELLNKFGNVMDVEHRSPKTGLIELDPSFFGSALAGAEKSRVGDPDWIPRTYLTIKGKPVEQRFQKMGVYEGQVPKTSIYSITEDPLGVVKKAQGLSPNDPARTRTLFEKLVKEAGFKGYTDGTSIAYFDKLPVQPRK